MRGKLFASMIRKNISWFDSKTRAPGVLTTCLTQDVPLLNGLTAESLGILLEALFGITISCAICFIFSWQLGFIAGVLSPLMILGGLGMGKLQWKTGYAEGQTNQANALLNDVILNYRTVISFGEKNVQFILEKYDDLLIEPHK
jgi:ABC-type multidrug transport system fused ATPase/permease subunit